MQAPTLIKGLSSLTTALLLSCTLINTAHAGFMTSTIGEVAVNSRGECWQDGYGVTAADKQRFPQCAGGVADDDKDGVANGTDQCPNTPAGAAVDAKGCELDSDTDGVVDSKDKCPNTPAGTKVDENGCGLAIAAPVVPVVPVTPAPVMDSDGDGVVDGVDRCPGTAIGARVNAIGCELDSDFDGVVDSRDKCPDTAAGMKVNDDGCAMPIILNGVNFEHDSSNLTGDAKVKLDAVAGSLKTRADAKIRIEGYTDSKGGAEYNQVLSQKRANAVRNYLGSQGVNSKNMETAGFGEAKPVATNQTEEGRAANRRVEIHTQ